MRIVYIGTSDHVIVDIDPQDADRPGDAVVRYLFDDNTFNAIVDLAIEERARFASQKGS